MQLTKDLKYGDNDTEVALLQNILKNLNLLPLSVPVVAHFGASTLKSVKDFQLKYDILTSISSQYGMVGPRTRQKLNDLNGK
jgi:peptidoglycan hydrolase-like protein with peptidoglycan-binding domain